MLGNWPTLHECAYGPKQNLLCSRSVSLWKRPHAVHACCWSSFPMLLCLGCVRHKPLVTAGAKEILHKFKVNKRCFKRRSPMIGTNKHYFNVRLTWKRPTPFFLSQAGSVLRFVTASGKVLNSPEFHIPCSFLLSFCHLQSRGLESR